MGLIDEDDHQRLHYPLVGSELTPEPQDLKGHFASI